MVEHVGDVSPDLNSFVRIEDQVRAVRLLQRVNWVVDCESVVQENRDLKVNTAFKSLILSAFFNV